jgi:hypothetical protein
MLPVYGGKCLPRKAVQNWAGKFCQGHWKVTDDALRGAEVAEITVNRIICCRFRHTGKAMGQVYQCWWRCREGNAFFFFRVRISHVLRFISICNLFTGFVRFEVFTAVTMKNAVLWDVAPCRYCVNRRFRGTYRLHLQGRKIREPGTSCSHLHKLVPRSRIFLPWRWRRYVPPKRRFTQYIHDATSQSTAFCIYWLSLIHYWLVLYRRSNIECNERLGMRIGTVHGNSTAVRAPSFNGRDTATARIGKNTERDIGHPDWGFSWFSSALPGIFQDTASTGPRPLPSKFFPIQHFQCYHSTLYVIVKYSTKILRVR